LIVAYECRMSEHAVQRLACDWIYILFCCMCAFNVYVVPFLGISRDHLLVIIIIIWKYEWKQTALFQYCFYSIPNPGCRTRDLKPIFLIEENLFGRKNNDDFFGSKFCSEKLNFRLKIILREFCI
jgi:hypothetical protein